jgi:tellurite methyltransferase
MLDPMPDRATAYQIWDKRWADPALRVGWLEPDPLVTSVVPLLRQRSISQVLDLGCGLGRHAHYLASQGFACVGVDASPTGIDEARRAAVAAGFTIDYRVSQFRELPFADGAFGLAIAWNVVYHGDGQIVRQVLAEVHRVLAPGGLYLGTMLSKRNRDYGPGEQVAEDTFVVPDDPGDKSHPHFYCDGPTLLALHTGFEVLELRDREQTPGHHHWEFIFERRDAEPSRASPTVPRGSAPRR